MMCYHNGKVCFVSMEVQGLNPACNIYFNIFPYFFIFIESVSPYIFHLVYKTHYDNVEMLQPKRSRELMQLVYAKGFGEEIDSLPIRWNIYKFHFTGKDTLVEKMIVRLNVLGTGVEDEDLRKLDVVEVVAVDRRWIRHLLLQVLS